jgi:hypothetical protein
MRRWRFQWKSFRAGVCTGLQLHMRMRLIDDLDHFMMMMVVVMMIIIIIMNNACESCDNDLRLHG